MIHKLIISIMTVVMSFGSCGTATTAIAAEYVDNARVTEIAYDVDDNYSPYTGNADKDFELFNEKVKK